MGYSLVDLHTDILTSRLTAPECVSWLNNQLSSYEKSVIGLAVWGSELRDFPLEYVRKFREVQAGLSPRITPLLCFEDIHYLSEENLRQIIELAPFCCSLTWNYRNGLGGGALSEGGLTARGRKIAGALSRAGVFLDVSHLNRESFFELLACVEGPVLATHSCFDAVRPHPRNLTAEQVSAVVEGEGLVGLTLVGDFLAASNKAAVNDVIRHVEWYLERFPFRHLALGSDFWGTENLPEFIENYQTLPLLVEKLLKIGYNETVIKGLLHDNAAGFIQRRGTHP